MMVATLTFVMLTIVEDLQGRQELAKTTLRNLKTQKKVTLRNQATREILRMVGILMSIILIEHLEIMQHDQYQRLKIISNIQ